MNVASEKIVAVALARVSHAAEAAALISPYSAGEQALREVKANLAIAAELLAILLPEPARDAA